MTEVRLANYSFTKLVVRDLEKMEAFYCEVYGLERVTRVRAEIAGEPIDEIILGVGGEMSQSALILLEFVGAPAATGREVILGFTTRDLGALVDRVRAAGGSLHAEIKDMPELKIRVAFATDPEGHLAELVEQVA